MPTNIRTYDGNLIAVANDGNLNTWSSTLKFPGRGYTGYGEAVMEDLVWTATHFSGNTSPQLPLTGQVWYDSGNAQIKVYDPVAFPQGWEVLSPIGSIIGADRIDPTPPTNTAVDVVRITDSAGLMHSAVRMTVNGTLTGVFSGDDVYEANVITGPLTAPGFSNIYPGLNINPSITNSTVASGRLVLDGGLAPGLVGGAVEYNGNNFFLTFPDVHGNLNRNTPVFESQLLSTNRIYVSLNGTDVNANGSVNDGFNASKPMRTLRAALASTAAQGGGYTILLESGTYYEYNPLYVPPKTSIVGDNLRRATIIPLYPQRDIIHVDAGTYIYGVTFRNHRRPAFAVSFPAGMANVTLDNSGHISVGYLHSYDYSPGTIPNVFVEPTLTNQGNISIAPNMVGAAITEIVVTDPGSGYVLPPAVTITGSSASAVAAARLNISGQVVAVEMLDPGTGYVTFPTYPTVTIDPPPGFPGPGLRQATAVIPKAPTMVGGVLTADLLRGVTYYAAGQPSNAILLPENGVKANVIRSFTVAGGGPTYTHIPHISIDSPFKTSGKLVITSSPYIQNSSSITGPFDLNGVQIPFPGQSITSWVPNVAQYGTTVGPNLPFDINAVPGFANVDVTGAGSGIRVDGQILNAATVIRSFVADAFTQINQGGLGHLLLNKGYAQFVSCFTTFSSVGYWARSGGFANISNSVIDFGDIGLKADGYYPIAYATGVVLSGITSTVGAVKVTNGGTGYGSNFTVTFTGATSTSPASGTAVVQGGSVVSVSINVAGAGYLSTPTVDFSAGSGGGAAGIAYLAPSSASVLVSSAIKPKFNSVLIFGSTPGIYTITNVSGSGSTWTVSTNPLVYNVATSDTTSFFDASNLSSGSLALEYVGSGTTYNALPVYGGIPIPSSQVHDGTNPVDAANAGRVYYVTIDNTGNFKVGNYFSVNFADGSIQLNPGSTLSLSGLASIGPFFRNSAPVGTYANEISDDVRMTHPGFLSYDHTTIPTQNAVNVFVSNSITTTLGNIPVNVVPKQDNTLSLGSSSKRWDTVWAGNAVVGRNSGSGTVTINGSGGLVVNGQSGAAINAGNIYLAMGSLQIGSGTTNSQFKVDVRDTNPVLNIQHSATVRGGISANTPSSGAVFVGTYAASDLTFGTNNLENARINQSTGYFGIGTTSPGSLLEVNSSVTNSQIRINAPASSDSILQLYDSGKQGWAVGRDGIGSTNNFFINWDKAPSTYDVNALTITPTGRVGIGIVPTAPLHVVANAIGLNSTVIVESFDQLASGPKLTFVAQRGTPLVPLPSHNGDTLGVIGTMPLADATPTYASGYNSYIAFEATEAYGVNNLGSQLAIGVTSRGTNTITRALSIVSDATLSPAQTLVTIGDATRDIRPVLNLSGSNVSVAIYGQQTKQFNDPGSLYFGNLVAGKNWMHMTNSGDLIPDTAYNTSNLGAIGSTWKNAFLQSLIFNDGTYQNSGFSNQSLGTNGYQVLPGGLWIQWGYVDYGYTITWDGYPDGSPSANVTFPHAFPNGVYAVYATNAKQGLRVDNAFAIIVDVNGCFVATKASNSDNTLSNYPVFWLAIGY